MLTALQQECARRADLAAAAHARELGKAKEAGIRAVAKLAAEHEEKLRDAEAAADAKLAELQEKQLAALRTCRQEWSVKLVDAQSACKRVEAEQALDQHRFALELEHERADARRKAQEVAQLEERVCAMPSLKQEADVAAIEVQALKQQLAEARSELDAVRADAQYRQRKQQLGGTRREIALEQEVQQLKGALQERAPAPREVIPLELRDAAAERDRLAACLLERDAQLRAAEQEARSLQGAAASAQGELRTASADLQRARLQRADAEREGERLVAELRRERREASRFTLELPRRDARDAQALTNARQKLQRELDGIESRSDSNSRASDTLRQIQRRREATRQE